MQARRQEQSPRGDRYLSASHLSESDPQPPFLFRHRLSGK
jgi:hypothetical protein